jgi:hypothetical protein
MHTIWLATCGSPARGWGRRDLLPTGCLRFLGTVSQECLSTPPWQQNPVCSFLNIWSTSFIKPPSLPILPQVGWQSQRTPLQAWKHLHQLLIPLHRASPSNLVLIIPHLPFVLLVLGQGCFLQCYLHNMAVFWVFFVYFFVTWLPTLYLVSNFFFSSFWWDLGFNSGLHTCKAGMCLLLETHLQSILLWLFWRWGSFKLFAWAGFKPRSSWVARITGMSHWHLAFPLF